MWGEKFGKGWRDCSVLLRAVSGTFHVHCWKMEMLVPAIVAELIEKVEELSAKGGDM